MIETTGQRKYPGTGAVNTKARAACGATLIGSPPNLILSGFVEVTYSFEIIGVLLITGFVYLLGGIAMGIDF